MNSLCTALADALRKSAVKWPEKFELVGSKKLIFVVKTDGTDYDLSRLDVPHLFPCDAMDAVAAALGMEFEVSHSNWYPKKSWTGFIRPLGGSMETILDGYSIAEPDKRTASLAALLAIITYALQEDGK